MRARPAWLLCLLLLGLVLPGTARRAPQHSMEIRTPGIDPAWYAGRRIRPVGRFGRRGAAVEGVAVEGVPKPGPRRRPACFPPEGGAQFPQDG